VDSDFKFDIYFHFDRRQFIATILQHGGRQSELSPYF